MRRPSLLLLQRWLLLLAPRDFRARFGEEVLECARRSLGDARRTRGHLAAWRVGARDAADIACSGILLRLRTPAMKRTLFYMPLVALASFGTAWIDLHQDEVQPAAGLLLLFGAAAAALDSRRALLWWLVLGSSIPGARLWLEHHGPVVGQGPFVGTLIAFLPAGIGVLLGLGLLRLRAARGRP